MTLAEPSTGGVTAEDVLHDPPEWRCHASRQHGGAHIVAEGELDLAVVPSLDELARTVAVTAGEALRVDLTRVTFADSSIVALLLRLHARAVHVSARLEVAVRTESGVLRTLTVCGAAEILNVV